MPELPEVETVKRGLESILGPGPVSIVQIQLGVKKLRYNPQIELLSQVKGQQLRAVRRQAKYLLFELESHYLLSHLGMTGSWRIENDQRKHDHIQIYLSDGRILTYHDARRFGMFEVFPKSALKSHPRFVGLGPDPVVDLGFSGDYLYQKFRGKTAPVKVLIMDQRVVVGVGNIYANEALYLSSINPLKKASKVTRQQCQLLAKATVDVLNDAIECGGTTISDFKQAGGSEGYFQNFLLVYGRDRELCRFCDAPIRSAVVGGRNSFWCPRCQKK